MGIVFAKTHTGATNIGLILLEVIGSVDVAGLVAHLCFFYCGNARSSVRLRIAFFLATLAVSRCACACRSSRAMAKCLHSRRGLFIFEYVHRGLVYVHKRVQSFFFSQTYLRGLPKYLHATRGLFHPLGFRLE